MSRNYLKIVRSIPERLQPISNALKPGVRGQGWIFQDGCFDENYHPFFLQEIRTLVTRYETPAHNMVSIESQREKLLSNA